MKLKRLLMVLAFFLFSEALIDSSFAKEAPITDVDFRVGPLLENQFKAEQLSSLIAASAEIVPIKFGSLRVQKLSFLEKLGHPSLYLHHNASEEIRKLG